MARTTIALVAGILFGGLAAVAILNVQRGDDTTPDPVVRDIVDAPTMNDETAEQHRVEQYVGISGVEQLMSLPSSFARSAAMHALAGRADSAGIQNLIFEADRVADDGERLRLLEILFFRLAELDPQSALVLARTGSFAGVSTLEHVVWYAWAHADLDEALFAAKTQTSAAQQRSAARSLYAAFGYLGNETTDRIEAELGISPDRSTRAQYLYRLADRSPEEAIEFINTLADDVHRGEYVRWLASRLAGEDPHAALAHVNLFRRSADGKRYESSVKSSLARQDPRGTIEQLLASGKSMRTSSELHTAMQALARSDLDAARQYFDAARSTEDRMMLGSVIAREMARVDPEGAVVWARSEGRGRSLNLLMSVISTIAESDPQRALDEALKLSDVRHSGGLVSTVISHIARDDPAAAAAAVDQLQDREHKQMASQQLVSSWIQNDPDAAISWLMDQDDESKRGVLQMAVTQLAYSDVDAALRLLPQLDDKSQVSLRQQIAAQLAMTRSTAEAQAFVRQFENQPGYDQLQASIVSAISQTDPRAAKQMADQLAPGKGRDRAYLQLVSEQAMTNPELAASWLNNISDERLQGAAIGTIAAQWGRNDPEAALQWVRALSPGRPRDTAIMHLAGDWRTPTREQLDLINSIEDANIRGQAKMQRIYRLMETNPGAARALLEDDDIPNHLREQLELMLAQYGT